MRTIRLRVGTGVATALLLAACSSGRNDQAATAAQLRNDMRSLAIAATAHNYAAASSALAALNADAAAAHVNGNLSDARLAAIRAAAARVQADLTRASSAPPSTGTIRPPSPSHPQQSKDRGHGHGHGHKGGDG